MNQDSIDAKLLTAKNAINNAKEVPEIKAAMAAYGYDDLKIEEGKALYDTTNTLNLRQKKEYGDQYQATANLDRIKASVKSMYMKHLKIARIALKADLGAQESLQLNGKRKKSFSGFLNQVNAFYANALAIPEVVTAMGNYNITEEKLQQGKREMEAMEDKYHAQLKEKGEAQQATKARDEALDDLEEWMGDFNEIARIALEDQSQLLEILGMISPS